MTSHPVVVVGQAVEAHRDGVDAGPLQLIQPLLVEQQPVGDHAPRELTSVQLQPHVGDVVAQQRLAAGEDDEGRVGVDMRRQSVDSPQKILRRHVGHGGRHLAVAAAVAAVHITTQRALPKKGAQRMQPRVVVTIGAEKFEADSVAQRHYRRSSIGMLTCSVAVPEFQPAPPSKFSGLTRRVQI